MKSLRVCIGENGDVPSKNPEEDLWKYCVSESDLHLFAVWVGIVLPVKCSAGVRRRKWRGYSPCLLRRFCSADVRRVGHTASGGVEFLDLEVGSMTKIKTPPPPAEWLSDGIDDEDARAAFRSWMRRSYPGYELECLVKEAWLEVMRRHEEERLH